jgi:hypothetical protein
MEERKQAKEALSTDYGRKVSLRVDEDCSADMEKDPQRE